MTASGSSSITIAILRLCGLIAAAGCVSCAGYETFVEDATNMPRTEGQMTGHDGTTAWSFAVDTCLSGQREGFHGVTFWSEDRSRAVRVIKMPTGPMQVAVNIPGSDEEFVPVQCYAVKGSVGTTSMRINHIPVLRGTIQLACEGVRGSAIFTCS